MLTDPLKNLKTLGLLENSIVADLGAGTGFYSIAAGKLVPKGKVYAVEVVRDFLPTIKNKVKEAHLDNVQILWGDVEKKGGTGIGDGVVDAVIASNILFQTDDKEKFADEVKRILKHKGKVLLIDSSPASLIVGSKTAVSKQKAKEIFEKKGFRTEREIDPGFHHYGIILVKN